MSIKTPVYIYNNEKKKNHSVVTAMIGSEIRAAIQNWRKENIPMSQLPKVVPSGLNPTSVYPEEAT